MILHTGKFIRYSEENNHGGLKCFYKCVTHTHTTGQNKENRHKTSTSPRINLFMAFLNSGQFILQQRNQPKPMISETSEARGPLALPSPLCFSTCTTWSILRGDNNRETRTDALLEGPLPSIQMSMCKAVEGKWSGRCAESLVALTNSRSDQDRQLCLFPPSR